jgi:hypothetical protein
LSSPALGSSAVKGEDILRFAFFQLDAVEARICFELEVTEVGHDDGVCKVRILLSRQNYFCSARRLASVRGITGMAFNEDALQSIDCVDIGTGR